MASSKVMKSSTSRNSDLSRRSSSTKPQQQHSVSDHNNNKTEPSRFVTPAMAVDGIMRSVYNATAASSAPDATLVDAEIALVDTHSNVHRPASETQNAAVLGSSTTTVGVGKSVDEVWREIVSGESRKKEMKEEAAEELMTLEDFLAKARAVDEADVKAVPMALTERLSGSGVYAIEPPPGSPFQVEGGSIMGLGNGVDPVSGRGRRGRVMLEPLDRAAQQRQKRMIKNRESAARSRERKQAYQVELESLVARLEEENDLLMKEKAERTRERCKQLMERVIPVTERQRPSRVLRRVQSMQW